MLRDVEEVLHSQLTMLKRHGQDSPEQDQTKLLNAFQEQLARIQRLLAARGIPVLYIQYRDCLTNRERTAEQINNFLGGGLCVNSMTKVVDQSLAHHTSL